MSFGRGLRWKSFYDVFARGLRIWAFYWLVLCVFRLFFLCWMHEYMGAATGVPDVLAALWRGLRLSMQTAGILTLVSFLPGLVLHYIWPQMEKKAVSFINGLLLVLLSGFYVASFPFYRQFHANFNQMVFLAGHDDVYALIQSLITQFYLPVRLAGAFLLAGILLVCLRAWLWRVPLLADVTDSVTGTGNRFLTWVRRAAFLVVIYLVGTLALFGGSLSWQTSVDWENAGVTKDTFLNETILDNPQALYRAYRLNERMLACNGLDFSTADIRHLAAVLAQKPEDSDDLDTYLTRQAAGATIEKPGHIFIILSESYANWPLLDKYKDLPISEGMRGIIAGDDADYCPVFLPNGSSTVSAVTGVVTGFADANLYLTSMPESFTGPYPTASAPQLKELGYVTNFWYAGPATWERVGAFTLAQGFDHFYSRGDYGDVPGSVWGCEDEVLYDHILDGVGDRPSFNVILNASNHSPFDVDLAAKGFDEEAVRKALPPEAQDDEELLRELGHYWYADREMSRFVREIKERYPDSLIVIVGDHADRYNMDKSPSTYEQYGIPFIITGRGIHKGTLLPDSAGSQIDIVPTILDLIAPQGFTYEALGSSLASVNRRGVNYGLFVTRDVIGKADTNPLEAEPIRPGADASFDAASMEDYINAIRSISWWRAKYGPILDESLREE